MEKHSLATAWTSPPLGPDADLRSELLCEVSRQLLGVAEPAEVARRLSQVLAPRLVESCGVELLDASAPKDSPPLPNLTWALRRLGPSLDRESLESFVARGLLEAQPLSLETDAGSRRAALLPLRADGHPLGAVLLSGRGLDAATLALAEEAVALAARALALTVHIEEERGARARAERTSLRMESLQALTFALSGALTLEQVALAAVEEAVRTLGADAGVLCLLDASGTTLELVHAVHYSVEQMSAFARLPVDAPAPIVEAARDNRPVWVEDLADYRARYPDMAALTSPGTEDEVALASLPLASQDRPLGALGLTFHRARRFDDEERAFLGLLARQCAMALDRARLLAGERHRAERTGMLQRATAALATSLDVEHSLRAVAAAVVSHLADFCYLDVRTVEGDVRRVSSARTSEAAALLAASQWLPPEVAGTDICAFTTGRPVYHPRVDAAFLETTSCGPGQRALLHTLAPCSLISVPLSSPEGTLGAMTLGYGPSGRHHTEEDLALAVELARRAAAAVQNALLFHQTQQAIQLRDEFLVIASHELNTPLTALKLHLARLQRATKDADAQARATAAAQQADRLSKLVRELLDVSRLSEGQLRLSPERLDLLELCHEALRRFGDDLARAGTAVHLSSQGLLHGWWDRARLDQVVSHLIANALKYGQGQPVDVELSARPDGTVRLVVRDRGIGIPPEQQARLFQRYERAVPLRNYGGFGLGLWMVKQVVEAHGGFIHLDSAPGVGTTLTVELPRDGVAR